MPEDMTVDGGDKVPAEPPVGGADDPEGLVEWWC